MKMSSMALSTVVVGLICLYDFLIAPMLEDTISQSVWVEMLKSGNMSAPIKPELRSPKVPSFMIVNSVGEFVLQDPIGPVEENANVLPFRSFNSKHPSKKSHL